MSATVQLLSTHLDGSTAAGEVLADLKQAALEAQQDAAKLAQTLYPPLLEARGLAGAIRAAAGLARVDAAVNVLEPSSFSADARNALYWLGVDALSAVPPGSEVSIRVQGVGSSVALEVITPARFEESPLQRLRDRVETLGGEVAKAENGNGQSRIYVTLPLPG